MRFWDTYGLKALSAKVRMDAMRDLGPCMSPFNAWLFLQGVETIALRAERHVYNTLALARWLEKHPCVNWVNYPGLETHPDYERAQRVLPKGQGGVLTFVGFLLREFSMSLPTNVQIGRSRQHCRSRRRRGQLEVVFSSRKRWGCKDTYHSPVAHDASADSR